MDFTLQPDEAEVLQRILDTYLADLRMEIVDTERFEMREALKQDEVLIKSLIARLKQAGDG